MTITSVLEQHVSNAIFALYGERPAAEHITISPTRKEFTGDYTVVTFPFTKVARQKPEEIADVLGKHLLEHAAEVSGYNVIKGFLNLEISDRFWLNTLRTLCDTPRYGYHAPNGEKLMIEYCSPNTNKPLHLGHMRNIILGWSCARLAEAAGYEVYKVQVINDRGIAICKSMLAWQLFGNGVTPQQANAKSDHFVGDYYVLFEKKFKQEYEAWQETAAGVAAFQAWAADEKAVNKAQKQLADSDTTLEKHFYKEVYKNTYFNTHSKLGLAAKAMLQQWEAGDEATVSLWKQMNQWVYDGFDATFEQLGVTFDKLYYESDTYLLGKDMIEEGLTEGVFYAKEDGSVWVNLEDAKLDHKAVLRSDGTSLYVTQDLGTANLRYQDFGARKMVYVVADEQNYHFQVLFEILKRLGEPYADGLFHLAYGMVDLTTGKMKSREGTVVDADDLMAEVIEEARLNSTERGTIADASPEEQQEIIRRIGLAALKFYLVKVQPRKRMTFDPKESVDLHGQTGPYIQNAYVRIQSVLRKAGQMELPKAEEAYETLHADEKALIQVLYGFPDTVKEAATSYDPSLVANYCYDLAKAYHKFYHDFSILKAESPQAVHFRLQLSQLIAGVLQTGMDLLGIQMPDRM